MRNCSLEIYSSAFYGYLKLVCLKAKNNFKGALIRMIFRVFVQKPMWENEGEKMDTNVVVVSWHGNVFQFDYSGMHLAQA